MISDTSATWTTITKLTLKVNISLHIEAILDLLTEAGYKHIQHLVKGKKKEIDALYKKRNKKS